MSCKNCESNKERVRAGYEELDVPCECNFTQKVLEGVKDLVASSIIIPACFGIAIICIPVVIAEKLDL